MKVSSLTKVQWRKLIMNLQEIAHEMNEAKQEEEKEEGIENEEKKD